MENVERILLTAEQLQDKTKELGRQISKDYKDKN